jgi:hypothetical protein
MAGEPFVFVVLAMAFEYDEVCLMKSNPQSQRSPDAAQRPFTLRC